MFCPKCGTEIPDDSQFCRKCGQAVGSPKAVSTGGGAAAVPAVTQKKNPWVGAAFTTIVVFGLAFIVIAVVYHIQDQERRERIAREQSQTPVTQPQLHRATIGTGAITVKAASFTYYTIPIPAGATNVRMQGHFTASGGSGNDVEVYLLNQDEYTNWTNRHQTPTFYNSGKVTAGDANVSLPNGEGTYYLVFNNKFSLLSPKAVDENFTLTYYQ